MTDQSVMVSTPSPAGPVSVFRERLLLAAEAVCSEHGLYEARIEDFTRHAGVAKGTFYLHFQSKEAIVRAVLEQCFDALCERCRNALSPPPRSRELRVRALVQAHLAFFEDYPGRLRLLHQIRGALKFGRPEWRPLRELLDRHLAAIVFLLALPPELPPADRRDTARLLFGAVSGVTSVWAATDAAARARLPRDLAPPLARLVLDFVQARRRVARASEFR